LAQPPLAAPFLLNLFPSIFRLAVAIWGDRNALMKKSVLLYVLTLVLFGLGIVFIMQAGRVLQRPASSVVLSPAAAAGESLAPNIANSGITLSLEGNLQDPLSRLFLQLIVILLATRLVGSLFVRIGQPFVVGEMFAGLFLGPSLLGWAFPGGFNFVFPESSFGTLHLLSQIGVCLFMFAVGMDLDVNHLRSRVSTAVVVSQASILFPYILGVAASLALFSGLAGPRASFVSFALFMGISMSITAFPVLARILQERGMARTPLGSTALACAAVGDVSAWCILAFVVAVVRASGMLSIVISVVLVVAFLAVMLFVIRPRLPTWFDIQQLGSNSPGKGLMAAVLVFTFLSSLTTQVIGVHVLFGAFLAGVVMPEEAGFRRHLKLQIENFSSVFLLPLFFAFTGLRTQIGLLNDTGGWLWCGLIIAMATVGKFGGTAIPARLTGLSWHDSFSLGALMNTRGLMELIAINIGYDLGILSPRIFAMLVLMALVTTFMTGPLLTFIELFRTREISQQQHILTNS
jgi:Kef-type K+ transport system membrane component KefB